MSDAGSWRYSEREGILKPTHKSNPVAIMARNALPPYICETCNQAPAVNVCVYCIYEDKGLLCAECGETHACGEEALLPVVNSPRFGECGYTGTEIKAYA